MLKLTLIEGEDYRSYQVFEFIFNVAPYSDSLCKIPTFDDFLQIHKHRVLM
jgi:hypothetical protein